MVRIRDLLLTQQGTHAMNKCKQMHKVEVRFIKSLN